MTDVISNPIVLPARNPDSSSTAIPALALAPSRWIYATSHRSNGGNGGHDDRHDASDAFSDHRIHGDRDSAEPDLDLDCTDIESDMDADANGNTEFEAEENLCPDAGPRQSKPLPSLSCPSSAEASMAEAPRAAGTLTTPLIGPVDENALFKELIDKHSSRLYRFILKHIGNSSDAEELAQQTFVEAVQAYRTFRGESQLSTWLYGIAMNLVRNYLSRSPHRRHQMTDESALDTLSEGDITGRTVHDPEQQFAQSQLFSKMDEALKELPEHMRELLILVGVDALSYEEAAVLLTVPIGTVRSRLSRARKALTEKLAARGIQV